MKLNSPNPTLLIEWFWTLKKEAGPRSEDKIIQYYKTIIQHQNMPRTRWLSLEKAKLKSSVDT